MCVSKPCLKCSMYDFCTFQWNFCMVFLHEICSKNIQLFFLNKFLMVVDVSKWSKIITNELGWNTLIIKNMSINDIFVSCDSHKKILRYFSDIITFFSFLNIFEEWGHEVKLTTKMFSKISFRFTLFYLVFNVNKNNWTGWFELSNMDRNVWFTDMIIWLTNITPTIQKI